jgi:N-acetylglucosamine-6-phosphate deacetylase
MELVGRHFATAQPVAVRVRGNIIDRVDLPAAGALPPHAPWIAPGFVDLQINGFARQEFTDPDLSVDVVSQLSRAVDRFGITRYCPTVTTHTYDVLSHALATIHRACETDTAVARRVVGIHLEGPYLSPDDGPRGAHPLQAIRPPDFDEFQRLQAAAGGRVRVLTLAPEYPQAASFIERVVATGVVVAIGHTAADTASLRAAVDAGARLSTHLGNGAHAQLRRHPNYIWDQLAEDRLWTSIIADGHHLPASVVKAFVRAKTPDRCILVSDMSGMAGMPPGRYENTSVGDVELLEDGRVVIAGQRRMLAGASRPIGVGVANVMRYAGVSLAQAVDMASAQPTTLLEAEPVRLEPGRPADLVQFDLPGADGQMPLGNLQIRATINGGEAVYGTPALGSR